MAVQSISSSSPRARSSSPEGAAKATALALLACGLGFRIAPLLDRGNRLLEQFPTEDGYLMLTIARNIALGRGMSTAAGTIPTNGTQPLVNLLYSLGFVVSGGDRWTGVFIALLWQILFAVLAAWLLWRLALRVLDGLPHATSVAWLCSSAWFASSQCMPHTMNCLETGAYGLVVLAVASLYVEFSLRRAGPWPLRWVLGMGGLLGVAFWVRNDAAFLIGAACVVRCLQHPGRQLLLWTRGMVEAFIMGATSVVIASPWLAYNKSNFGSIVPISGTSQSFSAGLGSNLSLLPVKLFEYLTVVLPVPGPQENHPAVCAVATVFVLGATVVLLRALRTLTGTRWTLTALVSLYGLGLAVYYGLFFGAAHFLGRYLFPLSPFLALAAVALGIGPVMRRGRLAAAGSAVLLVLVVLVQNVRIYLLGSEHMHFQVVEWVEQNVPEDVWVAAIQTGTLGFFHDRTINLDGKVNPEALQARIDGRTFEYVLEKQVDVLADWHGIEAWAQSEELGSEYEVVVSDPVLNLGVLRRRKP